MVNRVSAADQAVEAWLSRHRAGPVDAAAHLLTSAADRSKLWVAVAAARVLADRRNGGGAAARALITVAVQSAVVEGLVKRTTRRERPATRVSLRFGARRPPSTAFPSGHAASAAAAAVLLSDGMPGWQVPLGLLALAIAWSRVQTGLHHLSDVVGGVALGVAVGLLVRRLLPLRVSAKHPPRRPASASEAGASTDLRVH
jgi:undecaprenyl-diphosphatase